MRGVARITEVVFVDCQFREIEPPRHAFLPLPSSGHEVDRMLEMTSLLGAHPQVRDLEFPLLPTDVERADALLAGLPRPLIGVHPWSRDASRRWPPDRFGAVAEALRRRCGGAIVFLADSEGAVSLDACVMEGRTLGSGAVAGFGPVGGASDPPSPAIASSIDFSRPAWTSFTKPSSRCKRG